MHITLIRSDINKYFIVSLGCFLLSGLAALIYETAWGQQLPLVFGASELAIAARFASSAERARTGFILSQLGITLFFAAGLHSTWHLLRMSPLTGQQMQGEISYYRFGRSSTVMVIKNGTDLRLTTNGLPESAIQRKGRRVGSYHLAHWLALLPGTSRPQAKSALV